jgi:hypothetical protein
MVGEPLVISVAREADNPGSRAQTDAPHRCAFVTPGPTSSTMPARSLPWPDGNVVGQRSANIPFRIEASPGLIPAALTRTRTVPGPGDGRSTSTTCRTSSPPYLSNLTARDVGLLLSKATRLVDALQSPPDSPNPPDQCESFADLAP